jgi:hypothetical protein
VLQAIHYEPAVRNVAIALAALHERVKVGNEMILRSNMDCSSGVFALEQYVKAIRLLVDPGEEARETGSGCGVDELCAVCLLRGWFEFTFLCGQSIEANCSGI